MTEIKYIKESHRLTLNATYDVPVLECTEKTLQKEWTLELHPMIGLFGIKEIIESYIVCSGRLIWTYIGRKCILCNKIFLWTFVL